MVTSQVTVIPTFWPTFWMSRDVLLTAFDPSRAISISATYFPGASHLAFTLRPPADIVSEQRGLLGFGVGNAQMFVRL